MGTRHLDTMRHLFLLLLLAVLAQVWTEKVAEKVKAPVKVGKKKFSCSFTLVSEGDQVVLGDSKVSCTPNKPTKKKLSKASIELLPVPVVPCDPGYTRVCPSGEGGVCPQDMFSYCPYTTTPGAGGDTWPCVCLQTRMMELDIQAGVSPLGECQGECVCLSNSIHLIMSKEKPAFQGQTNMPSYCNN